MAFDKAKPMDDEYIAAGPAAIRENLRALKEDQIVDAGTVNGLAVGNASGNIPKANGTLCTNLNAQYLGGNLAGFFSPATHTHSAATTSSNGMMANTDKAKLDGISAGAQVNQNAFAGVLVSGTTIQADAATDTLELVAGSNIALAPDATNDRITIGVTGTVPAATIAASCTGNAATATILQTAHTIGINGDATGTATSFNGSTNITIPVTLATSGVTAGTYSSVTVDAKGRVTAGSNPATISANTTGNAATATTATSATTAISAGNAATATKLATPRTINLTGAIIGTGTFDGTSNLSIATSGGSIYGSGSQLFTSSGIFTIPAGVTKVFITLSGGGGGGSGGTRGAYGGRGGSGEFKFQRQINVSPGNNVSVTVGGAGIGGRGSTTTTPTTAGSSGGVSSFGEYITASGGGGGQPITNGTSFSSPDFFGKNGAVSDYAIGGIGGAGITLISHLLADDAQPGNGGNGATSYNNNGQNGTHATLYGSSGGGGGGTEPGSGGAGGNGGNGMSGFVLVEW
ncbi:MAG: hypothetical protein K0Q75_111 [Anaerospora sp.]|jgi:hypothetical protein|nr:hypothetical protein [Anaerospora sp.]